MSTLERTGEAPGGAPNHCEHCGASLSGGRFCSDCGHPVRAHSALNGHGGVDRAANATAGVPEPASGKTRGVLTEAHPQTTPATTSLARPLTGRSRRGLYAGIAAACALAAGSITGAVALGGDSEDADTKYRREVATAFGPVLGANRELSDELARLRGVKPVDARLAMRRAQRATTMATGALGALQVPAGSEQLARDAGQVLDRETAFLSAVGAVLANPSSPSRNELRTLSSNLTSAFSAAGPTVAGTAQTVSGAGRLAAWAPAAARTLKRRADKRAERSSPDGAGASAPAASTGVAASTATTNPFQNGRGCGAGVYAGPNTSCDFAFSVRDAYYEAPGATASVRAYSSVTGTTYAMHCSPSGAGVTCTGANNASVTF